MPAAGRLLALALPAAPAPLWQVSLHTKSLAAGGLPARDAAEVVSARTESLWLLASYLHQVPV